MRITIKTTVVTESSTKRKTLITKPFEFNLQDLSGITDNEPYTDIILPGGVFTIEEPFEFMSKLFNIK